MLNKQMQFAYLHPPQAVNGITLSLNYVYLHLQIRPYSVKM